MNNYLTHKVSPALKGKKAAILTADNFHVLEAYYPYFRLKEAGMDVSFVGKNAGDIYYDYSGEPLVCDISANDAKGIKFDLMHCPGGFAPMELRKNPDMIELAKKHYNSGRLFTAICHAASFLVSMKILIGKKATCYKTLVDDLINAGAEFINDSPVIDGNLITARTPEDLPLFIEAAVNFLMNNPDRILKKQEKRLLSGKKAGILVERRYHVHHVWYCYLRMISAGAEVAFIGERKNTEYFSRTGKYPLVSNISVRSAFEEDFDALVVPGDWAADKMRIGKSYLNLIRRQHNSGRTIICIAEGHSVLISAGILKHLRCAAPSDMKFDIKNAGAEVAGQCAIADKNILTGRDTGTLPELMRLALNHLKK